MTTATMQQRRATAADWTSANPVLAAGEIGWELDTGRLKIGDGATAWNSLGAFAPPGAPVLSQTVHDEDGEITFANQFNTAIIEGTASAMLLAKPALSDNGKRTRILKNKSGEITITSDTDALRSGNGSGNLTQGNTFTIKSDTMLAVIDFEACNEQWLVDGFPQFYGYAFISTVP